VKRLNSNGFHIVMVPLVIVILAIIGFTGWYVYNANKKKSVPLMGLMGAVDPCDESNKYKSDACPTPTPTVDPTANWKTFTSTKGNYSLKYPADWIIETDHGQDPSTTSTGVSISSPEQTDPNILRASVNILVWQDGTTWKAGQTIKELYDSWWKASDTIQKKTINNYSELTIDGTPAIKRETVTGPSSYQFNGVWGTYYYTEINYYFIHEYPFEIIYRELTKNEANTASTAKNSDNWLHKQNVDKMVKTLKYN
jgi:hypothetical protein